jgi:apolipoprotein N-acyltransferase
MNANIQSINPVMAAQSNAARRGWRSVPLWVAVAALSFHAAYTIAGAGFLLVVYLFALLQLSRGETWRQAWYAGLATGVLAGAPQLAFFWRIFGGAAVALWMVYALWIGLFVALARLARRELGERWGLAAAAVFWMGLEYFRSELYYLRFSWLNIGYAFSGNVAAMPLRVLGMYGAGFVMMGAAALASGYWEKSRAKAVAALAVCLALMAGGGWLANRIQPGAGQTVRVAGLQLEFPAEHELLLSLDKLVREHPEAELLVLSEYTFADEVPEKVLRWCRDHGRYLIVGGKDPAPGRNFFNTAFVIGPLGTVLFKQAKSVPIQFFKDGLPAPEQRVWDSPWGKLGICICYDLSYTRVTDRLIALGAQALVVPTMDVADWGAAQHRLHGRVAPVRAAEYGVPIFRLASSGISQAVDARGNVMASAPFPGDGAVLLGELRLARPGRQPLDRWGAPICTVLTALAAAYFIMKTVLVHSRKRASAELAAPPGALAAGEPEAASAPWR